MSKTLLKRLKGCRLDKIVEEIFRFNEVSESDDLDAVSLKYLDKEKDIGIKVIVELFIPSEEEDDN